MDKLIGARIKSRRLELGLTVDELAAKLKKNRATIYRYESNEIENMPLDVIEPLAKALNTTPAYLMGWKEERSPLEEIAYQMVEQNKVMGLYYELNAEGQEKAVEYMEMLVMSGKYKKHGQSEMVEGA